MKLLRAMILLLALAACNDPDLIMALNVNKGLQAYKAGDSDTALKELRPLAEQGNPRAQVLMGLIYKNGTGVLQDYAKAVKWFRLSAEQGVAVAQFGLGGMYFKGWGVLQDNIRAHMWINIASDNGDKNASLARDAIAAKMTSADISKAQTMARECMSSNYQNCGW